MANCSKSELTKIPKSLPIDTDWLILNGNNISSPEVTEIKHINSLSRIDLKDNEMKIISEDFAQFLSKHGNLDDLDISNNNLKTIPRNFKNVNILKLSLSGNRFQCTCNNMWMKNWLIESRNMIQEYNTVSCQLESGRHIPFAHLTDADLKCPSMFLYTNKVVFIDNISEHLIIFFLHIIIILYYYFFKYF